MIFPYNDINPTERIPYVTWLIIGLNVAVFVYLYFILSPFVSEEQVLQLANSYTGCPPRAELMQGSLPQKFRSLVFLKYGLVPDNLRPATFFYSMFLHGGPAHLLGNMLFLYITGDNLEDRFGHIPFLIFYLFCGLAAAATQLVSSSGGCIPMIGASGAIAGAMGAYMVLFPKSKIKVFLFLFPFITTILIPAFVWLGLWFVFQYISSTQVSGGFGGVAYGAHIGGFVVGTLAGLFGRITGLVEAGVKRPRTSSGHYMDRHRR